MAIIGNDRETGHTLEFIEVFVTSVMPCTMAVVAIHISLEPIHVPFAARSR